jgi:hypothetical protein
MPKLLDRLTQHLMADAVPDARKEAVQILRDRGHLYKNSERLTKAGKIREAMGVAGRAIDRAAKQSGHKRSNYKYVGGKAVLK